MIFIQKKLEIIYGLILISMLHFCHGCIEPLDLEAEQPKLELMAPNPCDTIFFGESFVFKARIKDNTGLGNISMDIHHNFGHHNHGAHESCALDPQKDALNPYSESWIFSLPDTATTFIFEEEIIFPAEFEGDDFDSGDYHFHFYLTDIDGYQVFTTMDLKVLKL